MEAAAGRSHKLLFERAFFVNADASTDRRRFMEQQLRASGVAYERWPAVRGSPAVLESHQHYFSRGVERHLRSNRRAGTGGSSYGYESVYD